MTDPDSPRNRSEDQQAQTPFSDGVEEAQQRSDGLDPSATDTAGPGLPGDGFSGVGQGGADVPGASGAPSGYGAGYPGGQGGYPGGYAAAPGVPAGAPYPGQNTYAAVPGQPGYIPGYPGPGYPPQGYSISPKSKIAGALLAFFLGGLGAHNFYFGQKNKAIAQLVITVGAVVAFIIGIICIANGVDATREWVENTYSYGYYRYDDNDGLIAAGVILFIVAGVAWTCVGIWAFVEFIMILSGARSYLYDAEGRLVQ